MLKNDVRLTWGIEEQLTCYSLTQNTGHRVLQMQAQWQLEQYCYNSLMRICREQSYLPVKVYLKVNRKAIYSDEEVKFVTGMDSRKVWYRNFFRHLIRYNMKTKHIIFCVVKSTTLSALSILDIEERSI